MKTSVLTQPARRQRPPAAFRRLRFPRPANVATLLTGIALLLGVLSMAGQYLHHELGFVSLYGVIDKFYLDNENNVPTYFSGLLLLLITGLLATITFIKRQQRAPYRPHWQWLTYLFALLSVDEIASIHELLIDPINNYAPMDGPFAFAWVIPGLVFVLVVGTAYLRFLVHLPPTIRCQTLLAAGVYVGGALGMEMVGSYYFSRQGVFDLRYSLIVTLEEMLEMTGLILFSHALLTYLAEGLRGIVLIYKPTRF